MPSKSLPERGRSTLRRDQNVTPPQNTTPSSDDRSSRRSTAKRQTSSSLSSSNEKAKPKIEKWTLGILNDKETEEVPGTVLLLSAYRNEPLGLEYQPGRRSSSSMPAQPVSPRRLSVASQKRTKDGQVILDPQPDDSLNDPLNWPAWRRDIALLSLGFYCMLGGGMTPLLAAGFNDVSQSFDVSYSRVALTTGLYMMGLGVGSVVFSPTAILFGKRPVYLGSAVMFILTSVWGALAPNYAQLATARVFQGISVSPVECLPSATIAEIFFLHERAFRVGIYTLLLLGGKNLVPLVSAVIINAKGWRWVFWVVALIAGFGFVILFFFVPETFWDRTPRPKSRRPTVHRSWSNVLHPLHQNKDNAAGHVQVDSTALQSAIEKAMTPRQHRLHEQNTHARFEDELEEKTEQDEVEVKDFSESGEKPPKDPASATDVEDDLNAPAIVGEKTEEAELVAQPEPVALPRKKVKPTRLSMPPPPDPHSFNRSWDGAHGGMVETSTPSRAPQGEKDASVPHLHNLNSPYYAEMEGTGDYLGHHSTPDSRNDRFRDPNPNVVRSDTAVTLPGTPSEGLPSPRLVRYTTNLKHAPPRTYVETLRPWNGRLSKASWFRVALRPFILFAYPSVLWSTLVYSLSIGWLIVLSEAMSEVYRSQETYNFTALQAGLVYISPFIGGILGTAVAGRVSDIIVRFMARKNGGVYEPEFRLVMAIPVAISTTIGLMGFGWSVEERDAWIVPTFFFGVISFGCSLGSTTSITFCVDSYRQYAGEALVTLNFSKNIFHGLVFSLFFASWLENDGPKTTFLAIGGIQIACMVTAIPMYIYGKRARMWTVRRAFMENF
ncbi:hypothetical protein AYO21_08826 [Fonsecaea monophora]|uniref:Major facilitator superfamily (MFS) profile domain-containing protein n=1 Tax=Fonsecaea monophora TaxID=254056 RepID=A0A177EY51_9EURO|nr:hypothetical protein AYO21_08826 [Fonsecaea monophora]OAG36973.1 hypothetical protein AYO21_08826 [Fonsecaea monophora]